jgi:hypothetical protein
MRPRARDTIADMIVASSTQPRRAWWRTAALVCLALTPALAFAATRSHRWHHHHHHGAHHGCGQYAR